MFLTFAKLLTLCAIGSATAQRQCDASRQIQVSERRSEAKPSTRHNAHVAQLSDSLTEQSVAETISQPSVAVGRED